MLEPRTSPDIIREYITDESGSISASDIEAVFIAENEEDIVQVIIQANQAGKQVTVSGAGTGITGSRVAIHGGWVLTTSGIREPRQADCGKRISTCYYGQEYVGYIDDTSATITVPAGIPIEALDTLLTPNWLFPPDPTERTAFIGGAIATNASGSRTFKYGPTREWVQALRVVLPDGEKLSIQRGQVIETNGYLNFCSESGRTYEVPVPSYKMPDVKNAAGLYAAPGMDLVDLFIGSEGLLGVVTEATLKLVPRPDEVNGQIAFFQLEQDAVGYVDSLRQLACENLLPVMSIEFFDKNSLEFIIHPQVEGKGYTAVYSEFACPFSKLDIVLELMQKHNCAEDWFTESEQDHKEQKAFRHSLPEGVNSYLRRHHSMKIGTDMVVPGRYFRQMLTDYHAAGRAFMQRFPRDGSHYIMFGHIGNWHLHVNFITHTPDEQEYVRELYTILAQQAVAYGGTLSGEHGVGKKTAIVNGQKVPYLELMYGYDGLMQIVKTKLSVDPKILLNIGNMVPAKYLFQN